MRNGFLGRWGLLFCAPATPALFLSRSGCASARLRQSGSGLILRYAALSLRLATARLGTVPSYYLPRLSALGSRE